MTTSNQSPIDECIVELSYAFDAEDWIVDAEVQGHLPIARRELNGSVRIVDLCSGKELDPPDDADEIKDVITALRDMGRVHRIN